MNESVKLILEILQENGYDSFSNETNFVILGNGHKSEAPISGAIELLKPKTLRVNEKTIEVPGLSEKDVAFLIINHHNITKQIKEGEL